MNDRQKTDKEETLQADLILRLRCAAGHLQAVRGMVETGQPYEQILHQLNAVRAALTKVHCLLIEQEAERLLYAHGQQTQPAEASEKLRKLIQDSLQTR